MRTHANLGRPGQAKSQGQSSVSAMTLPPRFRAKARLAQTLQLPHGVGRNPLGEVGRGVPAGPELPAHGGCAGPGPRWTRRVLLREWLLAALLCSIPWGALGRAQRPHRGYDHGFVGTRAASHLESHPSQSTALVIGRWDRGTSLPEPFTGNLESHQSLPLVAFYLSLFTSDLGKRKS